MSLARNKYLWPVAIMLAALCVRLIYLLESLNNPTFALPIVDAATYHDIAHTWVNRGVLVERLFWQPFFYPAFLASIYRTVGESFFLVRLFQVLAGTITCLLVYALGSRLFSRIAGVIAGFAAAFYGPLIFFECEMIAATWAALCAAALLLTFIWTGDRHHAARYAVLGILGALTVLIRPTFLPFFGVTSILMLYRAGRENMRNALLCAVVLTGSFLLPSAPVAVLNYSVTGRLTIIPSSGGFNFFLGNNAESEKTEALRPGSEIMELYQQAAEAGHHTRAETSPYFYSRTCEYMRDRPFNFLGGLKRKTLQFFSSREIPRNVDIYAARRWSRIAPVLTWKARGVGFPFGLLLPLAIAGCICERKRLPAVFWLFAVLYPLTIIIYFSSARYRLPLVPILLLPASAAAVAAIRSIRARCFRLPLIGLGIGILITAGISLPGPFRAEQVDYQAEMHYCLAGAITAKAQADDRSSTQYEEAIQPVEQHYLKAIVLHPDYSDARFNYGILLARRQDIDGAIAQWEYIVQTDPSYEDARHMLDKAYELQARGSE